MFLLVPACPGGPRQKAIGRLCVYLWISRNGMLPLMETFAVMDYGYILFYTRKNLKIVSYGRKA